MEINDYSDLNKNFTTFQIFLRIVFTIAVIEYLIMFIIEKINYAITPALEPLIDVIILVLASSPILYFWVIKPFVDSHKSAFQILSNMSYTDALTNLPNRRAFSDYIKKELARIKRKNKYFALIMFDLDKFKYVNDNYGHNAGDEVLNTVASRIKSITREVDILARLGGDEFLLLLTELDETKEIAISNAEIIANKLVSLINEPITFDENQLHVGVSVGITMIGPNNSLDIAQILINADKAMYAAKDRNDRAVVIHG